MSVNQKEKSDKDLREIPVGVTWEWDEEKNCLTYKTTQAQIDRTDKKSKNKGGKLDLRSGTPRLVKQDNRHRAEVSSRSELKRQLNATITINDVKNAALFMLSERYYIPVEFENFCNDKSSKTILEDFLLNLVNYFYWYFEKIDASIITNPLCIERSPAEKERIEKAEQMLKITLKALSKGYCMLILGLGSREFHHMQCGKNRVSCGFKDRGLYETLYPFCVFFVWLTFSRRDYELIKTEVGRLLKSDSFNTNLKTENIVDEENKEKTVKSADSKKVRFDGAANEDSESKENKDDKDAKPANEWKYAKYIIDPKAPNIFSEVRIQTSKKILSTRSPALVSLFPLPHESSEWLFNRRGDDLDAILEENNEEAYKLNDSLRLTSVGVIGQPARQYNMTTLALRGSTIEDESTNSEVKADFPNQTFERQASTINPDSLGDTSRMQSRPTTVGSMISTKE